ncbi:MAG: hypothetical protein DI585_03495 [Pseudomonas fluorescens]|nr:MAG: hypothetical protein DI585_03495 [Pseudomonas fluorescens]
MAAQQPVPQTPEQQLQAAKVLRFVAYFEICAMPWIILATFLIPGANLCAASSAAPYIVCESFFGYTLAAVMVWIMGAGFVVLNIAERSEVKAKEQLGHAKLVPQSPTERF